VIKRLHGGETHFIFQKSRIGGHNHICSFNKSFDQSGNIRSINGRAEKNTITSLNESSL
jgi:hypothetical protein